MKISRITLIKQAKGSLPRPFLFLMAGLILLPAVFQAVPENFVSPVQAREPVQYMSAGGPLKKKPAPARQQEIIEKNTRLRKLQEGIIDQKIKLLGSKQKERSLLGELEKIESDIKTQKKLLDELKEESEKQEVLISSKQEYLNQVLAEKKAHQAHVKNRLAAYYRMGSVGVMNVLFSSQSLPELLDFKEYFSIMVERDHKIIQQYLAEIRESNRAREDHAREKLRLMKLADELSEKEKDLKRIRGEKNILLRQVNTEQHLYNEAVSEIEEAVADLAATLQKLPVINEEPATVQAPNIVDAGQQKLPETPTVSRGFIGRKGQLDPPVKGTVATRFGQKIKGKFDSSTVSNGIDIDVGENEEIRAIYDGTVIHSGYLRGYGNLIIIDHGQQYFSLISRAAEFYKKEGTKVHEGEVIGITGQADPLYGKGIHLEIRKGSAPEDPLLWLKKDSLRGPVTDSAQ